MAPFTRIMNKLYRIALIPKTQREKSRLYGATGATCKSLSRVLQATLKNIITPEEKAWVDRIELLRQELNSSPKQITIIDYGAGRADLNFTDEEMYQGTVLTETVGDVCRSGSKPYFWCLLLFKLIREFRPSVCLELGTCLGISGCYQAAALKLNKVGKVITIEGADSLASLAKKNFQTLGIDNITIITGRFQDTLNDVLREHRPIDYAFVDGHHDEKATLAYFEQIFPFLSGQALLIFDDISWSKGMKRAWSAIQTDRRVKISLDLSAVGICIIDSNIESRKSFKIAIV